jgi:hypothetical protein
LLFDVVLDVVEDEELRLGAEHCGVGEAGAGEVLLRALRDAPGIAAVGFLGARLGDGAGQTEGRAPRRTDR